MKPTLSLEEQQELILQAIRNILEKVEVDINPQPVPQSTPCWVHKGPISHSGDESRGYPVFHNPLTQKQVMLHRFVGQYLYGFDLSGKNNTINHMCGRRRCIRHLEVCTQAQNSAHAVISGLPNKNRKLTNEQVHEIRKAPKGTLARELAPKYGVSIETITAVLRGHTYSFLPLTPGEWIGPRAKKGNQPKKGVVNDQKQQDTIIQNSSSPV